MTHHKAFLSDLVKEIAVKTFRLPFSLMSSVWREVLLRSFNVTELKPIENIENHSDTVLCQKIVKDSNSTQILEAFFALGKETKKNVFL